jgi:hypothetical protein
MRWPVNASSDAPGPQDNRLFVRDPKGEIGSTYVGQRFDTTRIVPADARDTGLSNSGYKLFVDRDGKTAYLDRGQGEPVEVWPAGDAQSDGCD